MAGCSSDSSSTSTTTPLVTTTPPPTVTPKVPVVATSGPSMVSPYFLHDGLVTKGAAQQVEAADGADATLAALLAGPTEVDEAAGLTTALSKNVVLNSVTVVDGVATVDFNRAFETADTRPQVAQVVFTLTQVEGVTAVQFLIDGQPNGATGVKPITRAGLAKFAPPALVDSPTPGQTVTAPIAVSGTAATPGGTVTYRLEGPSGSLLAEGSFTHEDDGTGSGPFVGSIAVEGYTGQAVLIMPAPAAGFDDATLTRIPVAIA